ncbi:MAG TPA: hypothetical protein VHO91_00720 [Rhodopila sp.]|nr:hypothetical protein [Rhodopila sp.]
MSVLHRCGVIAFVTGVGAFVLMADAMPARAWFTGASGGVMPPVMAGPPVYSPPPMHAAPVVRMPPNYAMPPVTTSPPLMSAGPGPSPGLPNAEPPSPPSYTVAPGIWVPPHWQGPDWVPGHNS